MQVFKAFFTIAKKRAVSAIIYFIIYAVICVLITSTAQDTYANHFQSTALQVSVADEDDSTASHALTSYLASIHNVSEFDGDKEHLLDKIYYRTLNYSLTIPAGFEEKLLAGETEELLSTMAIPGSNSSYYVNQQITQYLQTLQLYLANGYDMNSAIEKTDTSVASVPEVEVVSFQGEESDANSNVFYFFQYLPYVFICLLFAGMTPILVTMNGGGMKERTSCSALPSRKRTAQLSLGCTLYSFIAWGLFMVLYLILYGREEFSVNILYAVLNSFVFLLFAAAMALLISCFSPNDNTVNMLANIIGLGMAFLCGIFVPQSMLPDSVLSVAKFLPAYWYVRANNMLGGFGKEVFDLDFYWLCIGIQLLFTVAIFTVTMVFSKQRRTQHS